MHGVHNPDSRFGAHLTAPVPLESLDELALPEEPVLTLTVAQRNPTGYAVLVWRGTSPIHWTDLRLSEDHISIPAPSLVTSATLRPGAVYPLEYHSTGPPRPTVGPRWWLYRVPGLPSSAGPSGSAYLTAPIPLSAARGSPSHRAAGSG